MGKLWVILVIAMTAFSPPVYAEAGFSGVIRVIDGDTLDVGTTRVRLYGVDAPEHDQTCTTSAQAAWDCGTWVSSVVRSRYDGKLAECIPLDHDRYGRAVARCFVGHSDIAEELVKDGLAFAYLRYASDYVVQETQAAARAIGLHASRVQVPEDFRREAKSAQAPPRAHCAIKGNVSSKGTRIYHRPGQRDYDATRITAQKGERWFCSAAEAEAAGWRAAKR